MESVFGCCVQALNMLGPSIWERPAVNNRYSTIALGLGRLALDDDQLRGVSPAPRAPLLPASR